MTRHYIQDDEGNDTRTNDGNRLFWSDQDGDWDRDRQTVYEKTDYGASKTDAHYEPSTGRFKK